MVFWHAACWAFALNPGLTLPSHAGALAEANCKQRSSSHWRVCCWLGRRRCPRSTPLLCIRCSPTLLLWGAMQVRPHTLVLHATGGYPAPTSLMSGMPSSSHPQASMWTVPWRQGMADNICIWFPMGHFLQPSFSMPRSPAARSIRAASLAQHQVLTLPRRRGPDVL